MVLRGVCFIVGCHPCWKDDVQQASKIYPNHKICVLNYATAQIEADYLATVHGSYIKKFLDVSISKKEPYVIQRDNDEAVVGYTKIPSDTHAGSSLFAAEAMLRLGYEMAVLCGCPMTGAGGYSPETGGESARLRGAVWLGKKPYQIQKWERSMRDYVAQYPEYASRIRSMSGITAEVFGKP